MQASIIKINWNRREMPIGMFNGFCWVNFANPTYDRTTYLRNNIKKIFVKKLMQFRL